MSGVFLIDISFRIDGSSPVFFEACAKQTRPRKGDFPSTFSVSCSGLLTSLSPVLRAVVSS